MDDHYQRRDWTSASAAVSPALFGTAVGLALGKAMSEEIRRPVALTLAGVGLAAVLPFVVERISHRVNGPESKRGSQRRLRNIREGEFAVAADELMDTELGVG